MKILFTTGLFLMGLLSSNDLFRFGGDEDPQPASAEKCQAVCCKTDRHKTVVVIENTCPVTVKSAGRCNIIVKKKDNNACYAVSSGTDFFTLPAAQADTIEIYVLPAELGTVSYKGTSPGNTLIFQEQ